VREREEHLPGCSRLNKFNSSTTHHFTNKSVQRLAVKAFVSQHHEPRYATYAPPGGDADDGHNQGPDHTLYLRGRGVTVDYKGIHLSCKSHRGSSATAIVAAKAKESRALYEEHVVALDEYFEVAAFYVLGGFCPRFVQLVRDLVEENPALDFDEEMRTIQVAVQIAVGRLLAYLA